MDQHKHATTQNLFAALPQHDPAFLSATSSLQGGHYLHHWAFLQQEPCKQSSLILYLISLDNNFNSQNTAQTEEPTNQLGQFLTREWASFWPALLPVGQHEYGVRQPCLARCRVKRLLEYVLVLCLKSTKLKSNSGSTNIFLEKIKKKKQYLMKDGLN